MTADQPSEPEKQPLWKRALPIVIGVAIVIFLFGFVLPQFIDYEAVFRSIGKIEWWEWAILLVIALIRFVPEGWIYLAAQPGLSTSQGTQLFLVAETLSNVPPGGLDLISRFQMTRSWGFSAASSTSATIASWVFSSLSKIVLPILAVAFLAIDNIQDDGLDALAITEHLEWQPHLADIPHPDRNRAFEAAADLDTPEKVVEKFFREADLNHDGRITLQSMFRGAPLNLGPLARLQPAASAVEIIVASRRSQTFDPEPFLACRC